MSYDDYPRHFGAEEANRKVHLTLGETDRQKEGNRTKLCRECKGAPPTWQ